MILPALFAVASYIASVVAAYFIIIHIYSKWICDSKMDFHSRDGEFPFALRACAWPVTLVIGICWYICVKLQNLSDNIVERNLG